MIAIPTSSFAVEIRYPDNFLDPDIDEAKEYVVIAEQVKKLVLGNIA